MPTGTELISKDPLPQKINGYTKIYLAEIVDRLYVSNGMLVGINKKGNPMLDNMSLEQYRSSLVLMTKGMYAVDFNQILTYNNERFIVLKHLARDSGNAGVCQFFNDHEHHTTVINGFIRYNIATQQKAADKLLKTILSNIKVN